ncbi:hypothetical protein Ancab_001817 [Ancistrocladus abbreviatus]
MYGFYDNGKREIMQRSGKGKRTKEQRGENIQQEGAEEITQWLHSLNSQSHAGSAPEFGSNLSRILLVSCSHNSTKLKAELKQSNWEHFYKIELMVYYYIQSIR